MKKEQNMSEKDYIVWLEELAEQNIPEASKLIPHLLLEDHRMRPAGEWAKKLLEPLWQWSLFPFQGESRWVEVSCVSWEQATQLAFRLIRACSIAAGLHGCFRGGVVIDLRWCAGEPPKGWLDTLENCLHSGSGQFRALILAPPGMGTTLCRQMSTLDLQQILPQEEKIGELKEALKETGLTMTEKDRVLQRAERATPEQVEGLLHTIRRSSAVKETVNEIQLLARLEPSHRPRREIGFNRGMEYETD